MQQDGQEGVDYPTISENKIWSQTVDDPYQGLYTRIGTQYSSGSIFLAIVIGSHVEDDEVHDRVHAVSAELQAYAQ